MFGSEPDGRRAHPLRGSRCKISEREPACARRRWPRRGGLLPITCCDGNRDYAAEHVPSQTRIVSFHVMGRTFRRRGLTAARRNDRQGNGQMSSVRPQLPPSPGGQLSGPRETRIIHMNDRTLNRCDSVNVGGRARSAQDKVGPRLLELCRTTCWDRRPRAANSCERAWLDRLELRSSGANFTVASHVADTDCAPIRVVSDK
jgi:hypothetical protein